jgi:CO dehydrogenase/acetyl-CoA synthase gamma subunit (corrinoid Fe-S protein)
MLQADLYYGRIDVRRHLPQPGPDCRSCDAASCRAFAARLEAGELAAQARRGPLPAEACPLLTPDRLHAFRIALAPETLLPPVELAQLPRPVEPGLVTIGAPDAAAPLLLSGNHEGTVSFLGALLALTATPLRYLMVDTRGDSVDMAMILGSLTVDGIRRALDAAGAELAPAPLVLPGFAAPLAAPLAAAIGRSPAVGPISGAELPLFLGDAWREA